MAYIFQKLSDRAASVGITSSNTKEAIDWFRDEAQKMTSVSPPKLMNDKANLRSNLSFSDIGRMFMFFYDPKLKDVLPYYDKFPLIIVVEMDAKGFYGLNLHYLPPMLRAKLMDSLYTLKNNDKYNDTTKLQISYSTLKRASKFRYFAPCFKRYLFDHVQSNFLYVQTENWDKALMLPTERFQKADKSYVFKESQRMF